MGIFAKSILNSVSVEMKSIEFTGLIAIKQMKVLYQLCWYKSICLRQEIFTIN